MVHKSCQEKIGGFWLLAKIYKIEYSLCSGHKTAYVYALDKVSAARALKRDNKLLRVHKVNLCGIEKVSKYCRLPYLASRKELAW